MGTSDPEWICHIVDLESTSQDVEPAGHIVNSHKVQKAHEMVFRNTLGYSHIYEVVFILHL